MKIEVNPVRVTLLCFFLSIIWYLLFPLVSITTGELKPRGIYVDENALLVNNHGESMMSQKSRYIRCIYT
jgi:hypothetical protein